MFKRFKKNKKEIYCPVNGEVIAIEAVNDPVFASKAMGDGFAVEPLDGAIYAPMTGKVTSVFPTKHAIGLVTDDGLELLIHIGIDTVALNGEGFDILVAEGDAVTADTQLAKVDLEHLRKEQKPSTTMVIFTNLADQLLKVQTGGNTVKAVIGTL
ncbi:PTS sugar transporter subunit IIA [Candidatus Enterococcus ferrettii]|uniref:PTS system, sugar-specific IIA component n=1 Tax=Candidatus Enterococcus ferrettii TaxID=2815324 RepID=A0ABV0EMK7_9ENTE|nr:PTS glucose transporter subunit IIA [Enterococcus sp. 665A]MBO1338492.1 PTS glucose transporter subunit IIA [Enterococcus sp. 665A]